MSKHVAIYQYKAVSGSISFALIDSHLPIQPLARPTLRQSADPLLLNKAKSPPNKRLLTENLAARALSIVPDNAFF